MESSSPSSMGGGASSSTAAAARSGLRAFLLCRGATETHPLPLVEQGPAAARWVSSIVAAAAGDWQQSVGRAVGSLQRRTSTAYNACNMHGCDHDRQKCNALDGQPSMGDLLAKRNLCTKWRRPACLAASLFPLHLVCPSAHKSGCCSAPHAAAAAAATKMAAEIVAKKRKSSSSEDKQKDKKSKRKAAEEAGKPDEGFACMRRRTKFGLQPQNARLNRASPLLQRPKWLLERSRK